MLYSYILGIFFNLVLSSTLRHIYTKIPIKPTQVLGSHQNVFTTKLVEGLALAQQVCVCVYVCVCVCVCNTMNMY
jgi:hypothetical protein